MKIGIIAETLNTPSTGIGNYTKNLINDLKNVVPKKDSIYLINHNKTAFPPFQDLIIPNYFPIVKTYSWYPYVTRKIRKSDIDIVHNPTQTPTFFKFKQKYILTVHDISVFTNPETHTMSRVLLHKVLFPKTLKTADKIIAVSKHTKYELIKYFNLPEDKITVIYEAADSIFKPLNKEDKQTIADKYNLNYPFILYVGTLEPRKNIFALIKAFEIIINKNINYKLVIVGKKGWKYKEIFEYIQKKNLHKSIIFTDYIPYADLPGLYNLHSRKHITHSEI
ncbi:glycosyltransferase family 4 protein [Methanoplanus endosymbiosus]|uniref:Glycosyltransferase family 4 protein n=1 Tax=Methanoplanus endosymbiosus TaxID=33865 RepID=A0A9E7PKI8_9EURY|nr:glycosyltransferase family 1 protein [Methanoplanus endosymbiosus]UUX91808.1 glycosyltransferase family 4 protein [Methanoplanus endosymbiosus]